MEMRGEEEAIAKYLTQKMTDVERSAFEQKMSENPQLGQKVKLEELIAEGIKNYQKGILKTRLNQLEIGSSLAEMTSITTKITLSTIAVLVVGGVSYFLLTPNEILIMENQETNRVSDAKTEHQNSNIPLNMDTVQHLLSDNKEYERTTSVTKEIEDTTDNTPVKVLLKQPKKVLKSDKETLEAQVEVVLPDMDRSKISFDESLDPLPDFSDDFVMDQVQVKPNSELMVEIEMKKSKKLKYIYAGEKLVLIGDFSSSPYQIIEDNTIAQNKLYLYFEKEYYVLTLTSEKKALIPVRDIRLLDYLVDLRNK